LGERSSQGNEPRFEQENFDQLLVWLDANRDAAGKKYEEIRYRLIKIFGRRGCPVAEELADETLDRVCRKVRQIADTYVGDPALYFYGVAQNVYLEYLKKKPVPDAPPVVVLPDNVEQRHQCLEHCLNGFRKDDRDILLGYFQDDRKAKIDHRKELAERLEISLNTLRMRIHRLKLSLHDCIVDCLKNLEST
jgi:DNA-directed RNA polymerase specialized sigma24 family protein